MEELKQLTAGQKAVVDAYLAAYDPTETYDDTTCELRDTQTMIFDMDSMCDFDENLLCDYLAEKGFRVHYIHKDAVSGWILKLKR